VLATSAQLTLSGSKAGKRVACSRHVVSNGQKRSHIRTQSGFWRGGVGWEGAATLAMEIFA
jgi:hypothetical protein